MVLETNEQHRFLQSQCQRSFLKVFKNLTITPFLEKPFISALIRDQLLGLPPPQSFHPLGLELSSPEPVPGSFPSFTSPRKSHLLRQRPPTALYQQPQGPTVLLHSDDFMSFTALIPNQYIYVYFSLSALCIKLLIPQH